MKKFVSFFLSFLLIISLFSIINIVCVFADGENWLDGWTYRKQINLSGSSGAGSNYQIEIYVDYGSGSDSNNTVYLDGNCQSDFDDIRFTDNDGDTLLDYWLQTKIDSDFCIFWVEVADNLDSNQVIFIYYDNATVSSVSNGDNTFSVFDTFNNLDDWTELMWGGYDNGELSLDSSPTYDDSSYSGYHYKYGLGNIWYREDGLNLTGYATRFYFSLDVGNEYITFGYDNDASNYDTFGRAIYANIGSDEKLDVYWDGSYHNVYSTALSFDTWYGLEFSEIDIVSYSYTTSLFDENNTLLASLGCDFFYDVIPNDFCLYAISGTDDCKYNIDAFFMRKFVDSEPYVSSWGSEESESVNLFYLTFYHNNSTMGDFYVDSVDVVNGTVKNYTEGSNVTLLGVVFAGYVFESFDWSVSNSTSNPYVYSNVTSNATVWCNFGVGSGSESDFVVNMNMGLPIALGFLIAIVVFVFVIIFISNKRR